jgi:outer membrane protein OmpA-like peptidoglycan-associated protein
MKNYIQLIVFVCLFYSCADTPKDKNTSASAIEISSNENEDKTDASSDKLEVSLEGLGDFLNSGNENQEKSLPEENALKKLFQMGSTDTDGNAGDNTLKDMISSSAMLDLFEASGISREEVEKLINNPDSLKILVQKAIKNREIGQQDEPATKGRLSKEQLASKNTPTGVSLEEAILLVQADSGPEATLSKLKKIDSLAGTNVMEQMDLKEAGYLMSNVERSNVEKASPEEEGKMKRLRKISGQMHSLQEAEQLLADLEKTEKDIASGNLKSSSKYQETIKHQKKIAKIFLKDFVRKAEAAKKKFQQLNPDLYFGEDVGETYLGHQKKAVYLPLGKLSFADKVIKANHPELMTQETQNVLGEPDVVMGFLLEDITGIHSLGLGGDLTVQFEDNALTNVNGPDLYIFEAGQIEPTNLEISKDGKNWIQVGKIDGGVAEVDIESFVKKGDLFYYVRLTDLKKVSGLPGADVDAIAAIGAAVRLNLDSKVLFESGKSELKPEGIAALKELAKNIVILKRGNVIVEGHTDDVGSEQTNQKLSLARAQSVAAELKKLIPSSNFKWRERGLGESQPIVENDSDSNRAKNRRVEIVILPN